MKDEQLLDAARKLYAFCSIIASFQPRKGNPRLSAIGNHAIRTIEKIPENVRTALVDKEAVARLEHSHIRRLVDPIHTKRG